MKKLFYFLVLFALNNSILAQSSTVLPDKACLNCTTTQDNSAVVDIQSTDKGMLTPRMSTTQRTSIANPAKGLFVFDNITNSFWFYDGTEWIELDGSDNTTDSNSNGAIDYNSLFDYECAETPDFTMGTFFSSDDECGNLYDDGGPNGSYSNNYSGDNYVIIRGNESQFNPNNLIQYIYTKITIVSLDIEENRDSLRLWTDFSDSGIVFKTDITEPLELLYPGKLDIRVSLYSDDINNADGFHITWSRLTYNSTDYTVENDFGFFFDPEKQSIGGGIEEGNAWNEVGNQSLLLGYKGTSTGFRSMSIGLENAAVGEESMAIGLSNEILEDYSFAFGRFNKLSEIRSCAVGGGNEISGRFSMTIGTANEVSTEDSYVFGLLNKIEGNFSSDNYAFGKSNQIEFGSESIGFGVGNSIESSWCMAFGRSNSINEFQGYAIGLNNQVDGSYSYVFGQNNESKVHGLTLVGHANTIFNGNATSWVASDPIFMVGNGQSSSSRSTALTIRKDGNVGIGTTNPSYDLQLVANSAAKPSSSTWTVASDRRLKKNIKPFEDGLNILSRIKPVWFNYTGKARLPADESSVGIIAQEMQKIAPYMVKNYEHIDDDGNKDNYLGFDANALFYITINAIKEQQQQIKEKEEKIEELEIQVEKIQAILQTLIADQKTKITQSAIIQPAKLGQNAPNPFEGNTIIPYTIPNDVQKASILIHNINGQLIKSIAIQQFGEGTLELQTTNLSNGQYTYSLEVDGMIIATKKMNLVR